MKVVRKEQEVAQRIRLEVNKSYQGKTSLATNSSMSYNMKIVSSQPRSKRARRSHLHGRTCGCAAFPVSKRTCAQMVGAVCKTACTKTHTNHILCDGGGCRKTDTRNAQTNASNCIINHTRTTSRTPVPNCGSFSSSLYHHS